MRNVISLQSIRVKISHGRTQTHTDEEIFFAADIVAGKIVGPAGKMIKKS